MIKLYMPADALRRNPHLFLKEGIDAGRSIVLSLIETALHDGCNAASVRICPDFYLVMFDKSWIAEFYQAQKYEMFPLLPLGGRQNTFRGEILLSAFCDSYAFIENGEVLFVYGRKLEHEVVKGIANDVNHYQFCIVLTPSL